MKINFVTKIDSKVLADIDYFLCCSGFESRSSYFFSKNIKLLNNAKKICFLFFDRKVHARDFNDKIYEENGFQFKSLKKVQIEEDYVIILNELFEQSESKKLNIVIDYSSMTTMIYAALLKYFYSYNKTLIEANLFFAYTRAVYSEPLGSDSLLINQPISIFDTIQTTNKRISLIIGLGYERDKALGLYEYFQNNKEDIYLFIAKNSENDTFYNTTNENNKDLIKMVSEHNVVYYDLENVQHLVSTLDSLVLFLISSNKRVVIAPTGPKIFTLISLLINLFHKDVTTYRLSHGLKSEAIDKKPDEEKPSIITHINLTA
jgi:hypothetical protein